jgi:hypothetical protein
VRCWFYRVDISCRYVAEASWLSSLNGKGRGVTPRPCRLYRNAFTPRPIVLRWEAPELAASAAATAAAGATTGGTAGVATLGATTAVAAAAEAAAAAGTLGGTVVGG